MTLYLGECQVAVRQIKQLEEPHARLCRSHRHAPAMLAEQVRTQCARRPAAQNATVVLKVPLPWYADFGIGRQVLAPGSHCLAVLHSNSVKRAISRAKASNALRAHLIAPSGRLTSSS